MITNGFCFGLSDEVTLDVNFPAPSSYISVTGATGNIVYENTAGEAQWFPGAQLNFIYPIGARRILSSGTVNGTLRTTTATGLIYCSGTSA
jgi:hypothetical protein